MSSPSATYEQPLAKPSLAVREEQIEYGFIGKLQALKYEYRPDIRDRAALERNFREKFEALNRVNLTDGEFTRLLDEIVTPDVFTAARKLRERETYDGDGISDIAVYRPSSGHWFRLDSSDGAFVTAQFGTTNDRIVPADYTGDGKADIAVWRPSNGTWYVLKSEDGTFSGTQFGSIGDIPILGDQDGDGRADLGVWRPGTQGVLYFLGTTTGFSAYAFGLDGDRPTANSTVF